VERVLLPSGGLWQDKFNAFGPERAKYEFSHFVQKGVMDGLYRAKAVVTDHFSTASVCNETFSLVVDDIDILAEELSVGDYVVGATVVYCLVASNPAIEDYRSAYACAPYVYPFPRLEYHPVGLINHGVLWETVFTVEVHYEKYFKVHSICF
jgi:hypothetical protein